MSEKLLTPIQARQPQQVLWYPSPITGPGHEAGHGWPEFQISGIQY
jgi:hypothetical protein